MASTIQIKSGTGSAVPTSLVQAELAINVDSGSLYYGTKDGAAVSNNFYLNQITASSNISSSETITGEHIFSSDDIVAHGQISASGKMNALYHEFNTNGGAANYFVVSNRAGLGPNTADTSIFLGGNVRIASKEANTAAGLSEHGGSELGTLSVLGSISGSSVYAGGYKFTNTAYPDKNYIEYDATNDLIQLGGAAQVGTYLQKGFQFVTTGSSTSPFIGVKFGELGDITSDSHITASSNISASGTIITSTLSGGATGDQSGSLYLSGSLTFRDNEAFPAVSSSALYVTGSDGIGTSPSELRFGGMPIGPYTTIMINCGWQGGTANKVFLPFAESGLTDLTAGNSTTEYHAIIMPFDGYVDQVLVRSENDCGDVIVGTHIQSDGTENPSTTAGEAITVDMSTDDTTKSFKFTSSTFTAGQTLSISFDPVNVSGDSMATLILKYDLSKPHSNS